MCRLGTADMIRRPFALCGFYPSLPGTLYRGRREYVASRLANLALRMFPSSVNSLTFLGLCDITAGILRRSTDYSTMVCDESGGRTLQAAGMGSMPW